MLRFAVCDDEPHMADLISDKLREYYPGKCEIKCYVNGKSLLEDTRREAFDGFFLDIGMPDMDGTTLAKKIREDDPYAKIVFVTNREELAHLGYLYGAFRFVRKSKLEQELREAADSLKKFFDTLNEYLDFKTPDGVIIIDVKSIKYFEVVGHNVHMVCNDRDYIVCGTMRDYCDMLKNRGFIQTHKSYLVNYRYIHFADKANVVLTCGRALPLSRKRVNEVMNKLQFFLKNTGG